jgi:hypothetical protein
MGKKRKEIRKSCLAKLSKVIKTVITHGLVASEGSVSRLVLTFKRALRGNDISFRSPLLKQESWEEIRNTLQKEVADSIGAGLDPDFKEIVLEYEKGELSKVDDMSSYLPWCEDGPEKAAALKAERDTSIPPKSVNPSIFRRAVNYLRSMIPPKSLKRTSILNAITGRGHTTWTTSMDTTRHSGFPWCKSGWFGTTGLAKTIGKATINLTVLLDKLLNAGKVPEFWFLPLARIQAKPAESFMKRKRIVTAGMKHEAVYGRTYTIELLNALTKVFIGHVPTFPGWRDAPFIELACQLQLHVANEAGLPILSSDISSFDQNMLPGLSVAVMEIVDTWFEGNRDQFKNFQKGLSYNWGLVTPDKIYFPSPGGMCSGASITNLTDTMDQAAMWLYGAFAYFYSLKSGMWMGDDGTGCGEGLNPESLSSTAKLFNWDISPEKQLFAEGALSFLQRFHKYMQLGGVASLYRILGRACGYERIRFKEWNWALDVIRWTSLLGNLAFSPGFEQAIQFIMDRDRYKLGKSMSADELFAAAGPNAEALLNPRMTWQDSIDKYSFEQSAVRGVLRGETLPPLGSVERFLRIYNLRAVFAYYHFPIQTRILLDQLFGFSNYGLYPDGWNNRKYDWFYSKSIGREYGRDLGKPFPEDYKDKDLIIMSHEITNKIKDDKFVILDQI